MTAVSPTTQTAITGGRNPGGTSGLALTAGCGILLLALPIYLNLPLTNDAEVYDLQANIVREGGVLYRDLLEPNLPGVVAIHLAVRSLAGESTLALRVFDLLMLAASLCCAAGIVRLAGGSRASMIWTVTGLAGCYLSLSEWCHCQRDVWMLPFALGASLLRVRATQTRQPLPYAMLEGLLWGLAVWLKPHAFIVAAGVWIGSWIGGASFRVWLRELLACVLSAAIVGAAGIAGMWATGCWPYFVETWTTWNPGYFAAGRDHANWQRGLGMVWRMMPWSLLLLGVAYLLLRGLFNGAKRAWYNESLPQSEHRTALSIVMGGCVAWTWQAVCLQHQFDYVLAPTLLLSFLAVVLANQSPDHTWRWNRVAWTGFSAAVFISSPYTEPTRMRWWPQCVSGTITPEMQADLMQFHNPSPRGLLAISEFLQGEQVSGREVCFYNSDFISLYQKLRLRPPTRYAYLFETLQFFPDRSTQILDELDHEPIRFVVTDLVSCGIPERLAREIWPVGNQTPATENSGSLPVEFPWNCPVVFREGTYLVLAVPQDGKKRLVNQLPTATTH